MGLREGRGDTRNKVPVKVERSGDRLTSGTDAGKIRISTPMSSHEVPEHTPIDRGGCIANPLLPLC
eukprot:8171996-Prorocentrum_lima.AAC.1